MAGNQVTIDVRVRDNAVAGFKHIGAALRDITGSAIIPAAAAVASLGVELVGAGAAVGVFGAAVAPQISKLKEVNTAQDAYNKAVTDYGKNSSQASTALKKYHGELASLNPAQKAAFTSFSSLKQAFGEWSDSLSSSTLPVFTHGMNGLKNILPLLSPLVRSTAKELGGMTKQFEAFSKTQKFKDLVKQFSDFAAGALKNVIGGVKSLALTLSGWVTSAGFKDFLAMGSKEGPGLATMFKNLAEFVGKFVSAAGPMAGLSMKVLEIMADVLNNIPMGVLKILAPAILGIVAALRAWTIAQAAFNLVMDANPITLIVLALVALGVALSIAWHKSETFREIVVTAWEVIQRGALMMVKLVLQGLKFLVNAYLSFVGVVVHGAAKAFGWVPGLGGKLKQADKAFQNLKQGVNSKFDSMIHKVNDWDKSVVNGTRERKLKMRIDDWNNKIESAKKKLKTVPPEKKAALKANIADLQAKVRSARSQLATIKSKTVVIDINERVRKTGVTRDSVLTGSYGYAHGGIVGAAAGGGPRSNSVMVGEQGAEIVDLPTGSRVRSNADTRRIMGQGGGGGMQPFVLQVVLGDSKTVDLLIDPLRKSVQKRGGVQAALGKL